MLTSYYFPSGQATYYSAGLGSCGNTNSDSDAIVAMNSAQYSSGQCGKTVSITNTKTGQTQTGTVQDECPGCGSGSLDLSSSLFKSLNNGNTDDGTFPISWSIN